MPVKFTATQVFIGGGQMARQQFILQCHIFAHQYFSSLLNGLGLSSV
jgi:hypothetical protein